MTEKDAVRLRRAKLPERLMRAMYYQPISMDFIDGPDQDFVGSLIAEIEYGKDKGKDSKGGDAKTKEETDPDKREL